MYLWVLCLKLWWLALPLSTLQHPSSPERRRTIATENLAPRDAGFLEGLDHAVAASEIDRRAQADTPFFILPDGRPVSNWNRQIPKGAIFNPVIFNYEGPGRLFNFSSNNPDPYPASQRLNQASVRPSAPIRLGQPGYRPSRPVLALAQPPYTEEEPDWPPVDPYPPKHADTWSFDWGWPEIGKKVVEVKGEINLKTSETDIYVAIMGFPLGDFKGDLDDGMRIDINLGAVKGFLEIYLIPGKPKDQVWMRLNLRTFLRHWQKNIHMFDIPHQDRVKATA